MNLTEARTVKQWLTERRAILLAHVDRNIIIVIIKSPGGPVMGVGKSDDDFEEAVRLAQHHYDLGVLQLARMDGTVGEA
jgi:hypothetical protein